MQNQRVFDGNGAPERRSGPLDGFRGLAVLAVVLYHLQVPGVGGGLLGVDVFFVLSGYLITGLLLQEWARAGAISLAAFWARRARRLLPALLVVLTAVVLLWRSMVSGAEFDMVRRDALATLVYGANWHSVAAGHSYFAAFAAPSPLLHTWSLSVEEQFYLVWPVVAALVLTRRRSSRLLLRIAATGAVVSGAWMLFLSLRGADPSRLYFGTDTRAQTIMLGAVLAVFLHQRGYDVTGRPSSTGRGPRHLRRRGGGSLSRWPSVGIVMAGSAGALFVTWACLRPEGQGAWLYRGGLFALALACDAVLAAIVLVPRCWLARIMNLPVLRGLGLISYGVYLIHWPVIVGLTPARTGLSGGRLDVLRAAVTLGLAIVSYYLVELPIRERRVMTNRGLAKAGVALAGVAAFLVAVPVPRGGGSTLTALAHASPPPPPPTAPVTAPSPTTTLPPQVLAAAVVHPGPERVMLEGDSVGWSLGIGIGGTAQQAGIVFANEGYIGCGIAVGGATSFAAYTQPAACLTWPARWKSHTDTFRPDVTLVLLGRWELVDRVHDGVWMHIGEPAFDQYLLDQLGTVVRVLSSDGGRVAFLTAPCNDLARADAASPGRLRPDDANRVLLFNQLLARVVAAHPGVTELVPFKDLVCPGGQYQQTLDGTTLRTSDGVHMEPFAGRLFDQQLWPQIRQWLSAPVLSNSPSVVDSPSISGGSAGPGRGL